MLTETYADLLGGSDLSIGHYTVKGQVRAGLHQTCHFHILKQLRPKGSLWSVMYVLKKR